MTRTSDPAPAAPTCACRRPLIDRVDLDADGTGLRCVRCGRTIATRAMRPCSTPGCRGALMAGDSDGDLCGKCHRTRRRAAAAAAATPTTTTKAAP